MTLRPEDVSVVIPAFNAAQFIDEAIESVVGQTARPGEIIVVDDGSTDATAQRCRAWAPDVTLLQQDNAGPGSARNAAMAVATGGLFALLDADDVWKPTKLELQLGHLIANPDHVAVFCWMQNFIDEGADLVAGPRTQMSAGPAYQASTLLAHRSVLDTVGPFDEIGPLQGWVDWYLRLHESGLGVGMVDELLTMRRIHGDNMSLRLQTHTREVHRFLHESLQRRRAQESQ